MTRTTTAGVSVGHLAPVILLESNENRDGFILQNTNGVLFVKLSKYASNTNFTYRLTANTTLELSPYSAWVTAISQNGMSDVLITELF